MLKLIFSDRRLWLLGLILGLALVVTRFALPADKLFQWVVISGYWFMLVLVGLFFAALGPVMRARWSQWKPTRFEAWVAIGVVACVGLWAAHEKKGFKILADEVLLLGTSMGMHFEREAAYPVRMTDVQGPLQILSSVLDKRPILFPFLVSVVHDLTGYRPSNPFYLNMGLSVIFLGLIYLLGNRLTGNRWAGVAMGLLFAGLPLMAQQATGGGFELLNLLLLAATIWFMADYLREPSERRLEVMIFAGLLLASTRYESVLFMVPVAVAAVWGWVKIGRVVLTWPLVVSPLFLMPVLVQNRIFSARTEAWEMGSMPGTEVPFSVDYLPGNLGHALAFFFDFSGFQPSSPLFAALGLATVPFFGLGIMRVLRERSRQDGESLAWSFGGIGLFALSAVLMVYFWGQFDHPVIRRLSLPTHLLFAMAVMIVGGSWLKTRGWKILSVILLGGLLLQSVPVMAKRAYAKEYTPGVEMAWRQEFIDQHPLKDYLFIDKDSVFWITQRVVATPIEQAKQRKEGLAYHLRNHSFSAMYVFQRFAVDPDTGALKIDPTDDIGVEFEIDPVWEKRIATLLVGRIGRVTAIREGEKTIARHGFAAPASGLPLTEAELEKVRAKYLENWIKQLP